MFEKMQLTKWQLEDYGSYKGDVDANLNFFKAKKIANKLSQTTNIFEIVQIGQKDYQNLDIFIKKSMNDLYRKLNDGSKEEQERKRKDYKHLYEIWQQINNNQDNYFLKDELYNDLIYALHCLGYSK